MVEHWQGPHDYHQAQHITTYYRLICSRKIKRDTMETSQGYKLYDVIIWLNTDRDHMIMAGHDIYYSTGVQIVSSTLSDDSVLSESSGLFNPVLCVSQWNLFWQKNQPIGLCLSNQVRPGREWFPSPLGDFNRLFEGLIGELFKIRNWNMFYFFKWHQSGP